MKIRNILIIGLIALLLVIGTAGLTTAQFEKNKSSGKLYDKDGKFIMDLTGKLGNIPVDDNGNPKSACGKGQIEYVNATLVLNDGTVIKLDLLRCNPYKSNNGGQAVIHIDKVLDNDTKVENNTTEVDNKTVVIENQTVIDDPVVEVENKTVIDNEIKVIENNTTIAEEIVVVVDNKTNETEVIVINDSTPVVVNGTDIINDRDENESISVLPSHNKLIGIIPDPIDEAVIDNTLGRSINSTNIDNDNYINMQTTGNPVGIIALILILVIIGAFVYIGIKKE